MTTAPVHHTAVRFWSPENGRVFDNFYSLDTETTLIDENRPWIVPAFVVAGVFDGGSVFLLTRETVAEFLRLHADLTVVMHNAPFDLAVIQQAVGGKYDVYALVDDGRVRDTQILHRLLRLATDGSGEISGSSLEDCTSLYLGLTLDKHGEDDDGDQIRTGFGQYLHAPESISEDHIRYLADDIVATYRLFEALKPRLAQVWRGIVADRPFGFVNGEHLREQWARFGPLTHDIQLKAAIVLNAATRNGLHVDRAALEPFRRDLEAELDALRGQLDQDGYRPGSKGCKKALQRILRDIEAKHPEIMFTRTESGYISEASKALEPYADQVPFISIYLRATSIKTLLSTFLNKMMRGILHPTFDVLKNTGRTSAFGDISAQNLPRDERLRNLFIPSPGYVFLDADYSAVEMATLAQASLVQFGGQSAMADAINGGVDLHCLVASHMTGKAPEEVTKDERQKAKAVNFGFPGGLGAKTLRPYAKQNYGADLSEAEAEQFKNVWFDIFPEMRRFLCQGGNRGEEMASWLGINPYDYAGVTGQRYQLEPGVLGGMARKTFADALPRTGAGRLYTEEEKDYFWRRLNTVAEHLPLKWRHAVRDRTPSNALAEAVEKIAGQAGTLTLTGRLRANATYCARHNALFQGLAADGAKLAMWKLWRADYKIVNFIHDEFLIELPEQDDYREAAKAIEVLMIDGMKEVVPDVRVGVEYAVSRRWSKAAVAVSDAEGRLVPYEDGPTR